MFQMGQNKESSRSKFSQGKYMKDGMYRENPQKNWSFTIKTCLRLFLGNKKLVEGLDW